MISACMISSGTNETAKQSSLRRGRALLLSLATLALPSSALASPNYPVVIQEELDLDCTPQCIICHDDNYGGNRTANRPFALTLQSGTTYTGSGVSPVVGEDDDGLRKAIAYLAAREAGEVTRPRVNAKGEAVVDEQGNPIMDVLPGFDSDDDGVDDIAELSGLRDPSVRGVGDMCGPRYGCGARVEPRSPVGLPSALAIALGALGVGVVVRRRSRELTSR